MCICVIYTGVCVLSFVASKTDRLVHLQAELHIMRPPRGRGGPMGGGRGRGRSFSGGGRSFGGGGRGFSGRGRGGYDEGPPAQVCGTHTSSYTFTPYIRDLTFITCVWMYMSW
jgi:hypothetical protein